MNEFGASKKQDQRPLWLLLLRAAGLVESQLEAVLSETGLSLSKFGVLHHLIQADEALPLSRLAERLSCVKSNVTQVVDRLEVEGLVKRVDDPQDRRSVLAAVTGEGRRLYEAGNDALAQAEKQLLEGLTESDRKELAELLRRVSGVGYQVSGAR
ncbi:MAG TPA: MarR family transcriptional regulator [Acidobacteriota bacterium]|jgi:DNA-binding MarR family transcriptional regulator